MHRQPASHQASGAKIGTSAPSIVNQVLNLPGKPLDSTARAVLEPKFGHSFGNVRVHADAAAAESAQVVNARAYTVGRNVVFGAGQYQPSNPAGLKLIAHELAHVAQQQGMERTTDARIAPPDGPLEQQAEAIASGAIPGPQVDCVAGPQLQRAPLLPSDLRPQEQPIHPKGGTLPYHEAAELTECIRILGEDSAAYCRHQLLGEPMPQPTHHQLPGITSPLPIDVELNRNKTASFKVNEINVVFEPDATTSDPKKAGKAETNFNLRPQSINAHTVGGKVTKFTGPGPVEIRIRTTYGPGATPGSKSGYGRGTTQKDAASGNTSLGFHEGRHGLDFIDFMQTHPYPRFVGQVGMTATQFEAAMKSFNAAVAQFSADMGQFSKQQTDCVGTTIDTSNAANGVQTAICRQSP